MTDAEAHAQHAGLAHQFEDLEQQQEADTLGIWVFLVTEIMFFGGLFAAYAIYRWLYFAAFEGGSHILDIRLGAANTIVLLGSSLTMALSVRSAQTGNRRALVLFLIATMILGGIFLGVKAYEYNQKFVEHVVPSLDWAPEGQTLARLAPGGLDHAQIYFIFYFAMTGLHAIHMIIGMGLLLWLVLRARKGQLHAALFRAGRGRGPVLALRGYCLDFSVSVALPDRRALLMSQPIVPQKTYVMVFLCLIGLTILTTGSGVRRSRTVQHRGRARHRVCENAPRDFVLHGRAAQQRPGPNHPGRGFLLARPSDRLHHERLSHPFLDSRARFLVHDRSADPPIT